MYIIRVPKLAIINFVTPPLLTLFLECKNKSVKIIDSFNKSGKKGVMFYHSTLNYTLSRV